MSVVKRNIAANVLGGTWGVLLNLVAIPIQLRILGAEAYGLITFVISLQVLFTVLDFGLSTTVLREVASDTTHNRENSRTLLQTAAAIYWPIAVILGLGLGLSANWLVNNWVTIETLDPDFAATSLRIMAIWVVFSWPLRLYGSFITGLQRLEVVNALQVVMSTLNMGGGIGVLMLTRSLHIFLAWMAAIAFVNLVAHMLACRILLPSLSLGLRFSPEIIRRIWRFSLDMNLIAVTAIVFTQADRILISRFLPLSVLGYYGVAYNVTRSIAVIQEFINKAMLPTLSADSGRDRMDVLRTRYGKYAQLLVYVVALPTFVLVFFGFDFLSVWTTIDTARNAQVALILLALGFFFNASMSPSFTLAVATGHTRVPLLVNLYILPIYIPGLYFAIRFLGIEGAALVWVLLNLYYFGSLLPFAQRRILNASAIVWLRKNFIPFVAAGMLSFGGAAILAVTQELNGTSLVWIVAASATALYAILGFFFLEPVLRTGIQSAFRTILVSARLLPARNADVS